MRRVYDIDRVSHLVVGDPMYFASIADGTDAGHEKDAVFDDSVRYCDVSGMCIRTADADGIEVAEKKAEVIEVIVAGASGEPAVEDYLSHKYYPSEVGYVKTLGSDTAEFYICVNRKKDATIGTGTNGKYGEVLKYRGRYGFALYLNFDADIYTFDDVEREMCLLFGGKRRHTA